MNLLASFNSLNNNAYRRLYAAEVVSLLGDAITMLGIALLAFQLAGDQAAVILSVALSLRVAAFVIFSPYAGVLADRLDRKKILVISHLFRMAIIALLPFVQAVYQIYIIIFAINVFRAFFVPTLKASIPQLVPERSMYRNAISLYSATYQVLGILGPAVAGAFAWSHLWWALAYPLAGILGEGLQIPFFLWGGIISMASLGLCYMFFRPSKSEKPVEKIQG